MPDPRPPVQPIPDSKTVSEKRRRLSLVWLVPIIAAGVGVWVAATQILSKGPKITIVFRSADGLDAGKTVIRYMGVEVGTITGIRLSPDHEHVIAAAQMAPDTDGFFVADTQFWAVRPRISGANVTGLGTLISGAYIGMQIGSSGEPKRDFVALETAPIISSDVPGRFFTLKTGDLGSLDNGTPIFFRRLQVGQVASYVLSKNGQYFDVKIFVQAPYDQYVAANTRFWQASGIDMQLSASGLSVQTQSLLSILIGGVAFETPSSGGLLTEADADTEFTLFATRTEAFEPPARNPQTYELVFNESVRGLLPGAPVELRGIKIGEVEDIRAQVDAKTMNFTIPVTIKLDAQRLGIKVVDANAGVDLANIRKQFIDSMVARGVRAQLRTGNLLTGSVFIAFDYFPDAPPVKIDWSQHPVELPTIPGELEAAEKRVGDIITKLNKLPLQEISESLNHTLGDLDQTLMSARTTLDSANTIVAPDSAQRVQLDKTLAEIERAARSVRVLADYLERHPEALLRGKEAKTK
ncbi:MAG TPA: MlaD family protein [Candidatus Binataceae bacterium]|nr:MlaD family protein [Candidatus Binataceae bacterium]